jgi:hypothetical protein
MCRDLAAPGHADVSIAGGGKAGYRNAAMRRRKASGKRRARLAVADERGVTLKINGVQILLRRVNTDVKNKRAVLVARPVPIILHWELGKYSTPKVA